MRKHGPVWQLEKNPLCYLLFSLIVIYPGRIMIPSGYPKRQEGRKLNMKKVLFYIVLFVALFAAVTGIAFASEDYRAWNQGDSRWGSVLLGSSTTTMSENGCLVTCIAKLAVQAGLKDPNSFTPLTLVNWLNANGGFTDGGYLYLAKPNTPTGLAYYGDLLGSGSYSASAYTSTIISWINEGYHMVLGVNGEGHWVAVDEAKTLSTGTLHIMDSTANNEVEIPFSRYYGDALRRRGTDHFIL